jgi:conjugal transfer pilin signal peptidase TrbI
MSLPSWFASRKAFIVKAALVTAALLAGAAYFRAHYRVGIAPQASICLPGWRVFLVNLDDRTPVRGQVYAFVARGITVRLDGQTFFADGTLIAKEVAGVPGDEVSVTEKRTMVNGVPKGQGLALARTLARSAESFTRHERVPDGHYLFMGLTRDSYDGRYWGYVRADQVMGRATRLF